MIRRLLNRFFKKEERLIPYKYASAINKLGYNGLPTYYQVFKWFREEWGYTSWIEKIDNKFNYKVYAGGVYHKPIHVNSYSAYCDNYDDAESGLLKELIIIVEEIE